MVMGRCALPISWLMRQLEIELQASSSAKHAVVIRFGRVIRNNAATSSSVDLRHKRKT